MTKVVNAQADTHVYIESQNRVLPRSALEPSDFGLELVHRLCRPP